MKKATGKRKVFHGEEKCQEKRVDYHCDNGAYWACPGGRLLCGVHSKREAKRQKLPVNPDREKKKIKEQERRQLLVDSSREEKAVRGRWGDVIVGQLKMMKPPPHVDGFLSVFPNNKHANRKDGWGLAELSPMQLGPVEHGQPGLPPATSIENYHQFNKVRLTPSSRRLTCG